MSKKIGHYSQVFVVFIIMVSFAGCDMFQSVKDSFMKKNKSSESAQTAKQDTSAQEKSTNKISNKELGPNDLAKVGDWRITKEEFQERLAALREVVPDYDTTQLEAQKQVLEELIRQQLLVAHAEQTGLARDKDIAAAVDEFRRTLIVRESARRLTEDVVVDDDEAKAFYEEKKDLLINPVQWSISEIVVDSQLKANEVLVEVLKGTDFAEMARVHSISDTAAKGGSLGVLKEEPFPAMTEALLSLEEGEISSVFKGPKGFYIIKLDKKSGGEPIPFEEIREEIIQNQMLVKQQQAILDHLEKLRANIDVKVNEGLLQGQ